MAAKHGPHNKNLLTLIVFRADFVTVFDTGININLKMICVVVLTKPPTIKESFFLFADCNIEEASGVLFLKINQREWY
jgi:hypothetical protein